MEALRGFAAVLMFLCVVCNVGGEFNGVLLIGLCNKQDTKAKYYQYLIGEAISDVISKTPSQYGKNYYNEKVLDGKEPDGEIIHLTIRAHGVCTRTISPQDCYECLEEAQLQMDSFCSAHVGGQVQLEDCRLRFENYHFRND